jgi:hypothetical protein
MITISLPYYSEDEDRIYLESLRKQYSNVMKFSYNRFYEGDNQKQTRNKIKSLNNIDDLNSWLIQCAVKEGESIYNRNKKEKVIFGGKKLFYRRLKGLISKEEFKEKCLGPLMVQGEEAQKGNRLFKLDIIDNNEIIFKVSKNKHVKLKLPKLKNNYKKLLYKLETINDIKQGEKGLTYSIRLDSDRIYISFEEEKKKHKLMNDRYIGIDLNPNEIGVCVKEGDKILELQHFVLNIKENNHDKIKYEIFEISKRIEKLFSKWNCKFVFVEDLSIKSKQHNKGKRFNRMVNNQWIRNDFINNLDKRISVYDGRLFKINPAYSSFIGNLVYDYSDPINASLEIARRGYEVIILKNKKFYPEMISVKDHWKKYLTDDVNSWKEFFKTIKNLEMRYRVSLNEQFKVLSYLSRKSKILYYSYPI